MTFDATSAPHILDSVFEISGTATDNVERSLKLISELDGDVKAFVHVDANGARRAAIAADQMAVSERGPLHGVPVAIKEIFDVSGLRCTWGTPIHGSRVPDKDAEIVKQLKAAGAIVMGTVVSSEYAIASSSRTCNPWNLAHTAGVSSSGSAASVASGMVPLAIGSQTIGSTIRPASYCGVLGFKPTHDLISLEGAMPLSSRLDHVGIFARSSVLLEQAFDVLNKKTQKQKLDHTINLVDTVIKILPAWNGDEFNPAVQAAISDAADEYRRQGLTVQETSLPDSINDEEECLMDILCHDMAKHHSEDFDDRGGLMDHRVQSLIEHGRDISASTYIKRKFRGLQIAEELHDMLGAKSLFLTASTASTAPLSVNGAGSRITQRVWTLAGMPAISIPFSSSEGLPIGIQVIGSRNSDKNLIQMAAQL